MLVLLALVSRWGFALGLCVGVVLGLGCVCVCVCLCVCVGGDCGYVAVGLSWGCNGVVVGLRWRCGGPVWGCVEKAMYTGESGLEQHSNVDVKSTLDEHSDVNHYGHCNVQRY
jgi:hypothetical protein